ncbi:ABC transporter ATP-binding protein [Microvirga sp. VF16]|uniref:ABC transporter ATP-binding protein n=1 Tax=Microvirga sp. VF16 TaxID=2807101 RepID=UPI00193DFF80|nr:ABC transporter ATP-binding protein [Microvirga sp. VF16]QRM33026.1 ABC transporter ATP-binding protein [Microvirga sp. VF16]
MISLTHAFVKFGTRDVLRDVSFSVVQGRTLAILGPNGRGKTTALRALLGQQRLSGGSVTAPEIVGYVPQTINLAHPYRAIDVVVMGSAAHRGWLSQPGRGDRDKAAAAMRRTGVSHLVDSSFDRLSGGEKQMVLLARALATGSRALILDEPTAALDLRNQINLLSLLTELRREEGHAIIFTTHDPNHALSIADEAVLMMPDGKTLTGPVDTVILPETLEALYDVSMRVGSLAGDETSRRIVVPKFMPELQRLPS